MNIHHWTHLKLDASIEKLGEISYSLIKRLYPLCRSILAKLWVLNLSDGKYLLLEIAERAKVRFSEIQTAAEELHSTDLLALTT